MTILDVILAVVPLLLSAGVGLVAMAAVSIWEFNKRYPWV